MTTGGVGVCLATTAAQPGGVWRHICDLAAAYQERGIPLRLDVPATANRLRDDAERRGYDTGRRRFAREIFHAHLANTYDRTLTAAVVQARAAGASVILTEHLPRSDASDAHLANRPPRFGARRAKTAFKKSQYALADRIIAVSSGSATFLKQRYGVSDAKLATVFNGVQVDAAVAPLPATSRGAYAHFVATGSVIHQKGFDLLVDAGKRAQCDWRVDVYGTGPHLAQFQDEVAGLLLSDQEPRIVFHGWADDALAHVASADALVMTSRWEALPYSALEAMSLARPVIGTSVDGLTDVIIPGVTGVLMAPEPGAIAAALDAFSGDPSHASEMGRAGQNRVRTNFSLNAMVEQTVEVYQQSVGRLDAELNA